MVAKQAITQASSGTDKRTEDEECADKHYIYDVIGQHVYYGIFDGHGDTNAALYAKENLHMGIAEFVRKFPNHSMEYILPHVFPHIDFKMRRHLPSLECGTTAITTLLELLAYNPEDKKAVRGVLHTARIGDSQAVLCSGGKAIRLSKGPKETTTDQEKILDQVVEDEDKIINPIVFNALGEQFSDLLCVRSIKPYIERRELTSKDSFLILASCGVGGFKIVYPMRHLIDFSFMYSSGSKYRMERLWRW